MIRGIPEAIAILIVIAIVVAGIGSAIQNDAGDPTPESRNASV